MRKFLLLAWLMLCSSLAFTQTRVITGRVTDEAGAAIGGASVTVRGTNTGVSANPSGDFRINAKTGDVLVISATNYAQREIPVTTENSYTVSLTRQSAVIEEVVVTTALGIRRQAKELGYSTARVSNSQLTQGKAVNIQQGLAGKVSGVNITTVNSGVFEEARINLRGIRSLTGNNQPLLVVDNIPTPLTFLSSLNPTDVQDVSVLKGASASALYGPDGVNGVILITTRRVASGRPFVTIGQTVQLQRVSFLPKLQKEFGGGTSEDAFGRPLYDPIENQQFGPRFDGSLVNLGPELEGGDQQKVPYSANDDRRKFWNENGVTSQTDVSFGAQGFYMSFQDANVRGLMPKDKNRRTSFRVNGNRDYGKFRASVNLSYIQQNFDVVNDQAYAPRFPGSYNGSVYFTVLNTPAHVPLTSYKDPSKNKYADYSNYYNEYFVNPYWVIDNHRNKGRGDNLLASVEANYNWFDLFNATYRVGASFGFGHSKWETAPVVSSDYAQSHRGQQFDPQPGSVQDFQNSNSRVTHELFFNGRKEVSDFRFSYVVGGRYRQNDNRNISAAGNNLLVPGVYNLAVRLGEAQAFQTTGRSRLMSVFGQVSVNYKGWANLEFSGANDWDSRLNINNNSYFYPSVSGSVLLTDAIPSLKAGPISYAKIRGAVSRSANVNLGVYELQPIYNATNGFPYGNLGGFSAGNTFTDPLIEPEFVNSREVGIELGFLRNRINFDATYFFQKNTNQILNVQQSSATGYTTFRANAADFNNYGVELDLNLTPLVNVGAGRINFGINATYNNNKVISLFPGINELTIGGSDNFIQGSASAPDVSNFAIVGQPAFVFKLTDYKRDPQGRVIVDKYNGYPSLQDSLVTRGRSLPLWIVGLNPSFSWKGLSVGMTWDYRGGHHAYHGIGNDMDFTGISARSAQFGRERFVFPNSVYDDGSGKFVPNTNIQVANGGRNFWATGTTNTSVGTNYFSSAAFWKLREMSISYELPLTKWIGENKFLKRAIISAVGRNLLTILPDSNQWTDPEFNFTSAGNTFGINNVFSTPPARIFGGSIVLTF